MKRIIGLVSIALVALTGLTGCSESLDEWANYDTSMFTAHELNWFMKAFEDKLSKLRAA